MLVSGKNVIAIDGVKTGNTLKGDGVFNTPGSKLDVNTDIIATKEFVTAKDEEVVGKINAASATLSNKIDSVSSTVESVSSTLNTKINTVSSELSAAIDKKQDQLEFKGEYNRITAIGPLGGQISAVGGNTVDVSGGTHVQVVTDTTAQPGITTFIVSVTGEQTDANVLGENGLSSRQDGTTFYVGLEKTYKTNIEKIPGITTDISNLSSNKLDVTAYKPETFYPMEGNPSGFLTEHQSLTDYYTKQQADNKFLTKNSADSLYQPIGNYLTADALKDLSGNWEKTYTAVDFSSKYWNSAYDIAKTVSSIKNFSEIDVYTEGFPTFTIIPSSNSDKLELSAGKNISIAVSPTDGAIVVTAKDTTYTQGEYIEILPNQSLTDSYKINATGLVPVTSFNEYKTSAANELAKKQDKSAMSAYAESAWVVDNFLSANALDDLSGKWESASNIVSSHSANWDSVYETVKETSGDWNKVSDKLDKADFEEWSATIDTAFYSAGEGLALDNHTFSISAKYLSANALDDLSGKWEDAADNLSSNSAKWNSVYDTVDNNSAAWQNVVNSAEKWNTMYDEYTDNSAVWNDTTNTVDSYSSIWNEVSAKANSADLEELSGKVKTLSGELEIASATLTGQIDVLSGVIDNISAVFSADIDYISGDVEKKLYTEDFNAWSAEADITPYSAGKGLALNGHEFYVSADYALSADVYNKDEVDEKIAKFGGYTTANADESGYPDVAEPSTKFIYLVKMSNLPASSDNYKEWIYTSAEQTTAWECVGETTLDLTPYLTKDEASHTYQPSGYYVTSSTNEISAVDEYYGLIKDSSDNVKWAKIPDNDTTYTAGKNIVISGNDNEISVSGLFNTTLSSQDKSIGISAIPDASGNITYNLSVDKVELPGISGISGISAYYDGDQYIVGLENYNDIGFAKYSSSANVYTASAVVDGYTEDLNVNPTKITLNNDKILLKTGFYHIDVQTNFTIANPDNNYYNVFVKSIPNAASITQMIDGSYAHTETVDLSFDVRITNDDTPLEISVENYKTNETFAISNLNIHEIVSMPSQIEGGAGNYQAGDGISIVNDTIKAKIGNGLEIDASNAIQVKLGEGLKFDNTQGIQAITIDSKVEDVVNTVEELKEDLDTKITDNFPPAMITLADLQVANNTQYAPNNGGMLIGYLFTCPITHKIYNGSNNDYQTKIGIYTKQWGSGQDNFQFNRVILGIYEYNPDYNEGGQVGKTEALCDTGIIELQQGYAEYNVKNLFPSKTSPEMKPGKFYYASIYMSYGNVDTNGLTLFGAPGYNTQVNNLKPGITITNVNKIHAALYPNMTGYDQDLNFDKMGFSWQFDSYPPDASTQSHSQGIDEAHAAGRPYFAFRNVKITGN